MRRFLHGTKEQQAHKVRMDTLACLPPGLTSKLAWTLNLEWVTRIPCFRSVVEWGNAKGEEGRAQVQRFLTHVILAMQPLTFIGADRPPPGKLYIIVKGLAQFKEEQGVAGFNTRAMGPSDSWGAEDVILKSPEILYRLRVTALTFLAVRALDRKAFQSLFTDFPQETKLVRRTVLRDTFIADMSLASFKVRLKEWEEENTNQGAVSASGGGGVGNGTQRSGGDRNGGSGGDGGANYRQSKHAVNRINCTVPDLVIEDDDDENITIRSLSPRMTSRFRSHGASDHQ